MIHAIRRLALGLVLIAMTSGLLLYSDRGRRNPDKGRNSPPVPGPMVKMALKQDTSTLVYEDSIAGIEKGLENVGLRDKENLAITRYYAKGDMATANTIAKAAVTPLSKKWKVRMIQYVETVDVEEAEKGIRDALKASGLVEGRDYEISTANAQGDMATLNSLVDAAIADGADILIPFSTPALQAAMQKTSSIPIVFVYVASPIAAGAGTSNENHRPNVTGHYTAGAYPEMAAMIKECMPDARRAGTLFVPSEVNTVFHKDRMTEECRKLGIELVSVAANTAVDVPDAAMALCGQRLDIICQIGGNLTSAAFVPIARAARTTKIPIFCFLTNQAEQGGILAVARDYHDEGVATGGMAVRVMRGEDPSRMPFTGSTEVKLVVNLDAARACNFNIPTDVLKRADRVIVKK